MSGTIEPTLAEDVDKVLLIRLYPEADGLADAADKAKAQGAETAAAGAVLEASQHEPVLGTEAPDAPATAPPVNRDVPHASQSGDTLSCTMGNWNNEPTSYAYEWSLDGVSAGNGATHTVTAGDVGKSATCIVTATNAAGYTAAPPSNAVVVTAATRAGPGPSRGP